jgi:hypothetical protein
LILLQGTLNKSIVLIAIRRSRVVSDDLVGSSDSVKISESGRASHVNCDSREAIVKTIKLHTLYTRYRVSAKIPVF